MCMCVCVRECMQRILLVGEGNFSFAVALLELIGGDGERLTCTAYDRCVRACMHEYIFVHALSCTRLRVAS